MKLTSKSPIVKRVAAKLCDGGKSGLITFGFLIIIFFFSVHNQFFFLYYFFSFRVWMKVKKKNEFFMRTLINYIFFSLKLNDLMIMAFLCSIDD